MSVYDETFERVIDKALNILFSMKVDIYTFAFYYDHESYSIEVLVDTKSNSDKKLTGTEKFSKEQLYRAVKLGDLDEASRWQATHGRNFSLGDFQHKGLGWEAIKAPNNSKSFFLAMVRAVIRNSNKVSALSQNPHTLVFTCSSKDAEAGFIWKNFE